MTVLVGSILAYVFYWLCAILALVYLKFSEVSSYNFIYWNKCLHRIQGRTTLFGYESAAAKRRKNRIANKATRDPASDSGSPVREKDSADEQDAHGAVVEELRA